MSAPSGSGTAGGAPAAASSSSEAKAGSSNAASDPLASVITQVSATGQPAGGRQSGPARPTRVAKQGAAKGEKKKKARATDSSATTAAAAGETSEAGAAGAATSTAAAPVAVAAPAETSKSATAAAADDGADQTHSQVPSSTLVGTSRSGASDVLTSVAPANGTTGLTQDKPTDPALTPTEPDPKVTPAQAVGLSSGSRRDATRTTNTSTTKAETSSAAAEDRRNGQAAPKPTERASSKAKQQRKLSGRRREDPKSQPAKKPSLGKRILAALTCSAFGASAAAYEKQRKDDIEMNEKRRQPSNGKGIGSRAETSQSGVVGATSLDAAVRSPGSQTSSRRGSFDKTATAGRGTRLPKEETGDVMSGAVVPPGSSGVHAEPFKGSGASRKSVEDEVVEGDKSEDEDWLADEQLEEDEEQTEEQRLVMQGGAGIPQDADGNPRPLLPALSGPDETRKCLVLDLDETLVHSSFKMIPNADFIVPVEIEGTVHNVYVIKRPGVDEFMRQMGEVYEVVVFTASLAKYADPVLDILDIHRVVRHRLFRESCYNHRGNYVKDLSQLGRNIENSIIIDNSPASYIFHPNNAVPISSWFNDPHDTELTDLCPFLTELAEVDDVRAVLDGGL